MSRVTYYTVNEHFFDVIDTEEKAYWLGFIFADGSVTFKRPHKLTVILKDLDHILKLKKSLQYSGPVKEITNSGFSNKSTYYKLLIGRKHIALTLASYNPKKLKGVSIPSIPEELKRHFIRGYFDGDGSIYSYKNTSRYKNANFEKTYTYERFECSIAGVETFLEDINQMFQRIGVKTRYKKSKTDYIKYLVISDRKSLKLLQEYFYKDSSFYLDRKFDKWLEMPHKEETLYCKPGICGEVVIQT